MSASERGSSSSDDDADTRLERPAVSRDASTPGESFFGAEASPEVAGPTLTGDGVPDAPAPAPTGFPIADWNRYEYVSFLGRGGMGVVFKARDPQLRRHVALKFLVRAEPERARRFVAEARAQARVEHEHVCKVYEVGNARGVPYIAMQYIDGITLGAAGEQMSLEDKVHVMRKVADAVHAAHQGGLIHRDLKRSNVMVERTENGKWQPFVLDFGLARDVEAGATLYALLTGRPPNQGTTAEAFASLVSSEVPSIRTVAPQLPGELATIVSKCLEREPARRYASAAELAGDLRRYLAGEPIAARPRSLYYRASKRLRRSWRVAAALALAGAALIAVAVLVVHAAAERRLAEKRIEVAQRFGQEVARLETFMRQAYAAPLHDTRRERQHVLERMTAIQKESKQLGDVATGPAEYAVGRGYLSLHDYAQARTHLEAAVAAGYAPPEARYALGLTLAALYREGRSEADRIKDTSVRDTRHGELRKTLRDPALAYLRNVGETAPEAPAYAEGLIALYESDYGKALAQAALATQAAPWFYEAHVLAGDALAARATDADDHGKYPEAAADLERAGEEYAAALTAAPSDATLLDAECKRRGKKLSLAISTRQLDHSMVDPAIEPCERARQADPDSTAVLVREAFILADSADFLASRRGEKPDALMARALPLIDTALAADAKNARAYHARAILYAALADAQADHRENCEQSVDQAVSSLRKVIELDPGYADAYSDLAFQLQQRAEREREAGHDPRPILDEAVQIAERGIALAPRTTGLRGDLGAVWHARADYEAEHGLDPQQSLGNAITAFEAALAVNPKDASALNNMGLAIHTRAYYRLEHGQIEGEADLERAKQAYERVVALGGTDSKTLNNLGYLDVDRSAYLARVGRDPRPAVEEGIGYEERALAANPAERFVHFNTAGMRLTEAEYLVDTKQDPATALAAVQAAIDKDLARSKEPDPDILAYRCDAHVLAARAAMQRKQSPAAELAAADAALAQAEKLDATTGYVVDARINLERWRAESQIADGRDASAALARARAAASQAAEMVHNAPAARLYAGQIAYTEARSLRTAKGPAAEQRRAAAIATAKRELAAAVAGNKFYEHQVAPMLSELDSLAP
jgi:serine/threonine-protein kinase